MFSQSSGYNSVSQLLYYCLLVYAQGTPSTAGMVMYLDVIPEKDCVLAQVLKHCGAVPFAKTNSPQIMLRSVCRAMCALCKFACAMCMHLTAVMKHNDAVVGSCIHLMNQLRIYGNAQSLVPYLVY